MLVCSASETSLVCALVKYVILAYEYIVLFVYVLFGATRLTSIVGVGGLQGNYSTSLVLETVFSSLSALFMLCGYFIMGVWSGHSTV